MGGLWCLLLISLGSLFATLVSGGRIIEFFSIKLFGTEIAASFRFDALSSPVFAMVAILAIVIGHYSVRYLNGESGQSGFFKHLLGLVLSVSLLVLANNLLVFFVMWVLMSYYLHKLLLFFPERPNARKAAIKKQVISRLGDVAIISGLFLIYRTYGTTDLSELFVAQENPAGVITNEAIGLLLVLGAVTKSAQFPFHSWLPETMESPTPVSALMHAGVINAGGFLIIRFSPILQHATYAHAILLMFGVVTAAYASLVMMTQNNIKSKLAYSTISQMGIMLFACGLGAYGIALFHIVAHSFYKSHAFLSTGQIIEESKKTNFKLQAPPPALVLVVAILGAALLVLGYFLAAGKYLALFAYASVMIIALAQSYCRVPQARFDTGMVYGSIALLLCFGLVCYALVDIGLAHFLAGTVPSLEISHQITKANVFFIALALGIFVATFYTAGQLMNPRTPFFKRLYVHIWNGGYFTPLTHRWLSRFTDKPAA